MKEEIIIREAQFEDIKFVAALMTELGYDTTQGEMKQRFEHIKEHEDYKSLIALVDSQVAGMIGMMKNFFYEKNGTYVRVVALVISSKFRRKGIGKKLMDAAEEWAMEIGASTILLNCGNRQERTVAHIFYQKIGYTIKSSGFVKNGVRGAKTLIPPVPNKGSS